MSHYSSKGDALATALKFPSFSQNIVSSKEAIRCAKEPWRLNLILKMQQGADSGGRQPQL